MSAEHRDLPPPGATDAELAHLLRLLHGRIALVDEIHAFRAALCRERAVRDELLSVDAARRARLVDAAELAEADAVRRVLDDDLWWASRQDDYADARKKALAAREWRALEVAKLGDGRARRAPPADVVRDLLASHEARSWIAMAWCGAVLLPALVDHARQLSVAHAADLAAYGPLLPLPVSEFAALVTGYAEGKAIGRVAPAAVAAADRLPWQIVAAINAMHPVQAAELAGEWRRLSAAGTIPARVAARRLKELGWLIAAAHPEAVGATAGAPLGLLPLPPPQEDGSEHDGAKPKLGGSW